jgi:hypothetical protein
VQKKRLAICSPKYLPDEIEKTEASGTCNIHCIINGCGVCLGILTEVDAREEVKRMCVGDYAD